MKILKLKYFFIVIFCFTMFSGAAVNIPRGFKGSIFRLKSAIIEKDFSKARQYAREASESGKKTDQILELRFLEAVIEAGTGNYEQAGKKLEVVFEDQNQNIVSRFKAFVMVHALEAMKNKTSLELKKIKEQAEKFKSLSLTPAGEYAALNDAAGLLISLGQESSARTLIELADTLYKIEKKVYNCRYVDNAPIGVGGWLGSKLLEDSSCREARFDEYNSKAAAMLFADITAGRATAEGSNARKDYYAGNTAFHMVYDNNGWHIFFLLGESELEERLADDKTLGSLEVFFTPGIEGESYYQWITSLPSGETKVFDWNSAHRHYRYLGNYLKTEIAMDKNRIGSYAFIPWEALYDKLPLDEKPWRFSVIRWSPAGGFTWGGRVHETGEWGQVNWQPPAPEQILNIKKRIIRRARAKFNKSKQDMITFWTDKEIGGQDFYDSRLKAVIVRLDIQMGEIDKFTAEQIDELFAKYVPDWMEFERLVAELRHEYLENKIIGK